MKEGHAERQIRIRALTEEERAVRALRKKMLSRQGSLWETRKCLTDLIGKFSLHTHTTVNFSFQKKHN